MELSSEEILRKARSECDSFSLIWRDDLKFNENAKRIEVELQPYISKEERVRQWPETELSMIAATCRTYRVNDTSISTLRSVPSVYHWRAPSYPEDLAFYNRGKVYFASIAHESESWFTEK